MTSDTVSRFHILSQRCQAILRLTAGPTHYTLQEFTPDGCRCVELDADELAAFLRALPRARLWEALGLPPAGCYGCGHIHLGDGACEVCPCTLDGSSADANPFFALDDAPFPSAAHEEQYVGLPQREALHRGCKCPDCSEIRYMQEEAEQLRRGAKALGADSDVYGDLLRGDPRSPCEER